MEIVGIESEITNDEARRPRPGAGGRPDLADIGADHHARKRCSRLKAWIAGRNLPAASKNGGGIAQRFHFVELVGDVENSAAFAFEALECDKELIGLRSEERRVGKEC